MAHNFQFHNVGFNSDLPWLERKRQFMEIYEIPQEVYVTHATLPRRARGSAPT